MKMSLAISMFFAALVVCGQTIETDAGTCSKVERFLEGGDFKNALRELIIYGEEICSPEVRSEVLKLNGRYSEALEVLSGLESTEASRLRKELKRILGWDDQSTAYAVFLQEKTDTSTSELLFFVDDQPIALVLNGINPDEFPYRGGTRQAYIPDTSRSGGSESVQKITDEFIRLLKVNEVQLGPGCFGNRGEFYYTARYFAPVFSKKHGDRLSIYVFDREGKHRHPYWVNQEYTYAHPSISQDGWLYFSSDKPGGYGGMDIWRINLNAPNSAPINLGEAVNSPAAEVFPSVVGDSLYFVTNDPQRVIGGYDILMHHDGIAANQGAPLNGPYDDFNPYSGGSGLNYIISNRGGGPDNIYEVIPFKARELFEILNGRVESGGLVAGSRVELKNSEGRIVDYTFMDASGAFTFAHVKGGENYLVSFPESNLEAGDRLFLFDESYDLLEEITSDGSEEFRFALLTPEDYALQKQINEDESMLSIDIRGTYDKGLPGESGGVEIVLQDAEGNTIARSFTDGDGIFAFEQVKPDDAYTIKSNVVDASSAIRIFNDQGELIETIMPDSEGKFVFVRLKETDRIITITNEQNVTIKVEENEKFNLPAIYFETNDSKLNAGSLPVLDRLISLMEENPHVSIDLAGHTDSRGDADYNLKLSESRIRTVQDYLVSKGIPSRRITGKGFGESSPVNRCSDGVPCSEEEYAENRRTEIRFYNTNEP